MSERFIYEVALHSLNASRMVRIDPMGQVATIVEAVTPLIEQRAVLAALEELRGESEHMSDQYGGEQGTERHGGYSDGYDDAVIEFGRIIRARIAALKETTS